MKRLLRAGQTPLSVVGLLVLAAAGVPLLSAAASLNAPLWWGGDDAPSASAPPSAGLDDPAPPGRAGGDESDAQTAPPADDGDDSTAERRHCDDDTMSLEHARQALRYRDFTEADDILQALLDRDCLSTPSVRDQARFQQAYLFSLQDRPQAVLDRLETLEGPTAVDDYVHWLRGQALEALARPGEAAQAYGAIYDAGQSPLHWRARARQAQALVAAQQWTQARPVIEQMLANFPDYPRRYRLLYFHGQLLEALGDSRQAARAYQQAYFEFPHKREGQQARQRLQALAAEGFEPPPISRQRRYEKYRQLSVDKFWDLAHELLTELHDEVRADEGDSEFANEIFERIALNTYHSHDFEGAAQYFRQARNLIENGRDDGFNKRVIYRFHSFALGRLGRYEEALEALEKYHEDSSRRDRYSSFGLYYERYGRYEEAYNAYGQIYSAYQKRSWHYSYLAYKSGRFEEAYDNFHRLARRARGETRARYLYWAGRSLERGGNHEEAAEYFAELAQTRPNSYYGIQGRNRLLDLRQRIAPQGPLVAQADRLGDSTDQVLAAFEQSSAPKSSADNATASADNNSDPRARPIMARPIADGVDGRPQGTVAELTALNCAENIGCTSPLLSHPALGWKLGHPIGAATHGWPHFALDSDDNRPVEGLDYDEAPDLRVPRRHVEFPGEQVPRINFDRAGRIHWNGRNASDIDFVDYSQDQMIGPMPDQWSAYDDDTHRGALARAIDDVGHLFPELTRTHWLWMAGWTTEARRLIRDVALEFRGLQNRSRPASDPHELSTRRWAYLIDNRRRSQRAELWGMESDELRFPVPDDDDARQALLERQQEIHDRRRQLRPLLIAAFQEVGDYHMVRRFALDDTWWLRQAPERDGDARRYWTMAYPRAFPEKVIPLAEKYNINPYLIWSLMLVESSFNPDSISIADALGLLQVIPRTGLKIADLFGAEDFGPFDLLEADNSIEQGIFYFSRLVKKFQGQELLAFAGYNGGPHRVGGWLDTRGHNIPLDEFVEEIPFDQSRGYAKKVLRFLHIYLRLYEGYGDGIYVGQLVNPNYLPQPNF